MDSHATSLVGPSLMSLSSSTQSKLRSTQILTSLAQIASELVQNSLDAGARTIDVSLDAAEWECCVRDDGTGISREGLAILAGGSETGRYGTSKAYTLASLDGVTTFGFRGEALASAADVSCLEISSRTKHARECRSVILKGGRALYAGPARRWRRESPGTVVVVRDAFYNLPIRRRSHPSPSRTVELLKREIEAFALVFPGVSFSLESIQSKVKDITGAHAKTRELFIPKNISSTLAVFRHLYGSALADHVEEIDETQGDMRLEGFISLHFAYSKAYQFFYINRHPLASCDFNRDIDVIFARSSFSKNVRACVLNILMLTYRICAASRRSPRKSEKKPVYVLNLTIPPRFVDNCVGPAKAAIHLQNSTAAAVFVASVIRRILENHGFLGAHLEVIPRLQDPAPSRKRRKLTHEESTFDPLWRRPLTPGSSREGYAPGTSTTQRTFQAPLVILESGFREDDVPDALWTDPTTGEKYIVDTRTGNSYPQLALPAEEVEDSCAAPGPRTRMTVGGHASRFVPNRVPQWISEALKANNAYQQKEQKITALPTSSEPAGPCVHGLPQGADVTSDIPQIGQFTSAHLRGARVLGQVDRKFIACVINSPQTTTKDASGALVLIDQHAADERVRVERFLRGLCEGFLASCNRPPGRASGNGEQVFGVRTRALVPPVQVLVTQLEAGTVETSPDIRLAFAHWGVRFALSPDVVRSQDDSPYAQLAVEAVPEVVADKLLVGNELRDLVKGFIAKLETDGMTGLSFSPIFQGLHETSPHAWQRALRYCPRELVELVNSKACRGAIMFNDELTLEQCRSLLDKLSETALPFQCAHGRPSLVPLVSTGEPGDTAGARRSAVNWGMFMGRST
ncbi:hypothetical protein BD414DRAFT_406416 [Trametes punicea]|nr:hypothetical protein BD414DRAFT_406416 [Trametes punicea]